MSSAPDRWRLVLGRYAEDRLPGGGGDEVSQRIDQVLDYLYGREYGDRGARPHGSRRSGPGQPGGAGGSQPSALTVPEWIREVRDLFPSETSEVITGHALERYGMTELVTDAETLAKLTPNYDLLKTVLSFRSLMSSAALAVARNIVRTVVEELTAKLAQETRSALRGKVDRNRRSNQRVFANFDVLRTIRRNLANYDVTKKQLLARELSFFSRTRRQVTWDIIMAVDCSGSMVDSVIHSAVMAGIFHGLPSVRIKLVAFDTSVIDLSDQAVDPTEVLLSVQLGGGTDIGGALDYCAGLVEQPSRTILILVTDFGEGGSPARMLSIIHSLVGDGVKVFGLAALDEQAQPSFDRAIAESCAAVGAEVAAVTPKRLAEWIGQIIN